jgi:GNAT superfamily N-acetyltransferase
MNIAAFDDCSTVDIQLALTIDERYPPAVTQAWFLRQMFGDTSFLAASSGVPCAVLVACVEPREPTKLYIEKVAVESSKRRLGIAHALMTRAAEAAVRLGCRQMWLTTDPQNSACHAWERLGFAPDKSVECVHGWPVVRDFKGAGFDRVVFRRSLS